MGFKRQHSARHDNVDLIINRNVECHSVFDFQSPFFLTNAPYSIYVVICWRIVKGEAYCLHFNLFLSGQLNTVINNVVYFGSNNCFA